MINSKTLFRDFVNRIELVESRGEIESMAYLVFENLLHLPKSSIMSGSDVSLTPVTKKKLDEVVSRINRAEPVQYILGESFFYGRSFAVNSAVLIPRPETEELVRVVTEHVRAFPRGRYRRILDIGTGSGCIAVTLALELDKVEMLGTDISSEALITASGNAARLNANVQFLYHDVLKDKIPFSIDVIVSNPPYIAWQERASMDKNVLDYEPDLALFVDSDDPLKFYKAIVERSGESLTPDGLLAVEINERFGKEVKQLFETNNFFGVEVIQDAYGKERIVKGVLSS